MNGRKNPDLGGNDLRNYLIMFMGLFVVKSLFV